MFTTSCGILFGAMEERVHAFARFADFLTESPLRPFGLENQIHPEKEMAWGKGEGAAIAG